MYNDQNYNSYIIYSHYLTSSFTFAVYVQLRLMFTLALPSSCTFEVTTILLSIFLLLLRVIFYVANML
jgi:hypothetical protein